MGMTHHHAYGDATDDPAAVEGRDVAGVGENVVEALAAVVWKVG